MAWYPRYCEVSPSALSHPAPFLSQNCQISGQPKISWPLYLLHFTHSSKASPFLASQARNHQSEIGPRHIEKVIWGQNQTNLHKMPLTGLWSFLTDLFEIWSSRGALMHIAFQVLTENYSMPEMKEETFAQLLLSILILLLVRISAQVYLPI